MDKIGQIIRNMSTAKPNITENLGARNIPNNGEIEDKSDKVKFYCKTCGEPTLKEIFNEERKYWCDVHASCKCEREAEFKRRFNNLINNSLLGERYKNVSFENSKKNVNPTFDDALNRCKKYCELHEKVLKTGQGIYLFGPNGVGKTHLTACIANNLMTNLIPAFFTNLSEISKSIKSTYSKSSNKTEQDLMETFSNIKFLFFDDLGAEIFTKNQNDTWLQSILFDLINKRYNAKLPTIFSSNYSLNELINHRQLSKRTVSRIVEMTAGAVMKIDGKDLRNSDNMEDLDF